MNRTRPSRPGAATCAATGRCHCAYTHGWQPRCGASDHERRIPDRRRSAVDRLRNHHGIARRRNRTMGQAARWPPRLTRPRATAATAVPTGTCGQPEASRGSGFKLITTDEAARMIGCSPRKVRRIATGLGGTFDRRPLAGRPPPPPPCPGQYSTAWRQASTAHAAGAGGPGASGCPRPREKAGERRASDGECGDGAGWRHSPSGSTGMNREPQPGLGDAAMVRASHSVQPVIMFPTVPDRFDLSHA